MHLSILIFSKTLAFRHDFPRHILQAGLGKEQVFDLFFKNDAPLLWFASILLSKLLLTRAVCIADILPSPL